MIRRRGATLVALVALSVVGSAVAPPARVAAVEPKGDVGTGHARAPKADREGDRIFDDLEARLERLPAEAPVDVIVRLRERPTEARLADLARSVGPLGRTRTLGLIEGFSATLSRRQVEGVARHPHVVSVEEDSIVHASNDSAQAAFGVTTARVEAGVDGDGDGDPSSYSAADMVAAVIDTGIDAGHLDLNGGKVLAFRDYVGVPGGGMTAPYDDEGHGTHVAATLAGDGEARPDRLYRGVAPAAALVGVKVLNAAGNGVMSDVAAALEWVVDKRHVYGIEVINLSLGTFGCSDGTDAASVAVDRAHDAGLLVVVSAGNDGPGTCTVGSPAAARGALTVGSMADPAAGGFGLAIESSRGPTVDGRIKPDLAGPGVNIISARAGSTSDYVPYSGTSMAAPFTAGVALLVHAAAPALTAQQVRARITSTAIDWGRGGDGRTAGTTGADIEYGHGRLDAHAAIVHDSVGLSSPSAAPTHLLLEGSLSARGTAANHYIDVGQQGVPVAVTLIQPKIVDGLADRPDFDIFLYNPSGKLVAKSDSQLRQESLTFVPGRIGRYRLRVYSYLGTGPYFADVSYGASATPTPSPSPSPTPTETTTVTARPSAVTIKAGTYRKGTPASLAANENLFYVVDSTATGTPTAAWYGSFTGVSNQLSNLRVTYSGANSAAATQTISIWRWTDSTWVTLDTRNVRAETALRNLVPPGAAGAYVSGTSGDGDLRIRIRSTHSAPFRSKGDVLKIRFDRP